MRRRSQQSGFTLIELMITVAIIAILAAIAVPSFMKETRKAKGASEVPTVFSDLRTRIDQYHQENGKYPVSLNEATLHPSVPGPQKQDILPLPTAWTDLKVRISGADQVYCGYTFVTNRSGTVGTQATAFGFTAPATDWYYLLAKCDLDGDSTKDAYYFSSSVDPTIQKHNPTY
jgi:prepilin-type N-terminal cleavage/methylation domain-containing protein